MHRANLRLVLFALAAAPVVALLFAAAVPRTSVFQPGTDSFQSAILRFHDESAIAVTRNGRDWEPAGRNGPVLRAEIARRWHDDPARSHPGRTAHPRRTGAQIPHVEVV